MRIAVVGSKNFTLGFRLAGVRIFREVSTPEEMEKSIKEIMRDESIGILIAEGRIAEKMSREFRREIEESLEPIVMIIGGEAGIESLRERIRLSVGVDLWK
ncbi:MAG: V/A-type H+/Na+-transporting ATPase subunit [Archaeoglobi archaeon]|nr:V-type ATP synthase subunit F [Candidatus Mnemosynella bozhongmuii]MDK2781642.1 V/A-type H+/Na+-transporting ATPase subunit [Archaeoglobi archaeon]